MGISLELWRARIGRFYSSSKVLSQNTSQKNVKCFFAYGLVVCLLLVIGCVETHPGPASQKSDISEMKEILYSVRDLNQSLVAEIKHLTGTVTQLLGRIESVEKNLVEVNHELDNLYDRTKYLEDKLDDLENRSRRQNVVLHGVDEEENETWDCTEEKVMKVLHENLGLQVDRSQIERAHRTGVRRMNGTRPIICKFLSDKIKESVLNNCKKLQGTQIFIVQDYSHRIRMERQKLKRYMLDERSKGNHAYISYKFLYINRRKYSLRDLENVNPQQGQDRAVTGEQDQASASIATGGSHPSQQPRAPNQSDSVYVTSGLVSSSPLPSTGPQPSHSKINVKFPRKNSTRP